MLSDLLSCAEITLSVHSQGRGRYSYQPCCGGGWGTLKRLSSCGNRPGKTLTKVTSSSSSAAAAKAKLPAERKGILSLLSDCLELTLLREWECSEPTDCELGSRLRPRNGEVGRGGS